MRKDLLDRFYCGIWSLGVVVRLAALERTTVYIPRQEKDLRSNQDYLDISGASEALPRVFTSASAPYWSRHGA